MKIADSGSIKDGELELIDALTGDLDWGKIEKILKEKHKLGLQDEVVYNSGDLVVHKEKIAYRLDFDVKVRLRVLFDRDGQCISLSTSSDFEEGDEIPADYLMEDEAPSDNNKESFESDSFDTGLSAEEITDSQIGIDALESDILEVEPSVTDDNSSSMEVEEELKLQTDFINTEPDMGDEDSFILESDDTNPIDTEPEPIQADQASSDVMGDLINDLDDNYVSDDLIEDAASLINDIDMGPPEQVDNDTSLKEPSTTESFVEDAPIDPQSDEELSKQMEALEEPEDDEGNDQFKENISQMASQIADMISEINER